MIEALRAYIKTIAEFLLFLTVVKIISTEKSRKYINFVSGIILVLVASAPVINIFSKVDYTSLENEISYYYNEDFEYNNNALNAVFLDNIKNSLKNDILSFGVQCDNIRVELYDDLGGIKKICIYTNNSSKGADELQSFIKSKYGADNVEIY